MRAWREIDNERSTFGGYVKATGATLYVGRRCYRVCWWQR